MEDTLHSSAGLALPWAWCARCQRAYLAGAVRHVNFRPTGLHPHPTSLLLCPYFDCSANAARHGWSWSIIRLEHPEYPAIPKQDVLYVR